VVAAASPAESGGSADLLARAAKPELGGVFGADSLNHRHTTTCKSGNTMDTDTVSNEATDL